MKVLVIDDSSLHRVSARQTLGEHDLTVVGTYDEAFESLKEPWEEIEEAAVAEMERCGYSMPKGDTSDEEQIAYWKEKNRKQREVSIATPKYDVVLTDLLMPASKRVMGPDGLKYVGQETPVGFGLVLMAVQCCAKFAAVVTDTNHHDHPAAALLDPFVSQCPHKYDQTGQPPRFVMNKTVVGYYSAPMTPVDGTVCQDCAGTGRKDECSCIKRNAGSPEPDCDACDGVGRMCWTCRNSGKEMGKDWGQVIQHLLDN